MFYIVEKASEIEQMPYFTSFFPFLELYYFGKIC